MIDKLDVFDHAPNEESPLVIVRLTTSVYGDRRGLHQKKSLNYMKRLSKYHNFLEGDVGNIGAGEVLPRIVNLASCADGLYQVTVINETRDYETGYLDDYDYQLIPWEGHTPMEGMPHEANPLSTTRRLA